MRLPNQTTSVKRDGLYGATVFAGGESAISPNYITHPCRTRSRRTHPLVLRGPSNASLPRPFVPGLVSQLPRPVPVTCGPSCICEGGADCIELSSGGCCKDGPITCTPSGTSCSCVNSLGCDKNGNPPP